MKRLLLAAFVGFVCSGVAYADVRVEQKTQVKFEGMLGRMLNMFGGKATREGAITTVMVKGDRKMTLNESTAEIVDLAEEKVYNVDLRNKSYTVVTFADLRRQMEEAQRKASEQAAKESGSPRQSGDRPPDVEVDFSLKESGERRAINGFDAREVVMTVAVREKGKSLEENGGLVLTSNTWLAPKVAGMSEVADFDRRYGEKLSSSVALDAQQMAMLAAMYPMMQEAMKRFEAENVNMDGTPVLTSVRFEAVANAEQQAAESRESATQERRPTLGGLGGRLGRRVLGGNKDDAAAAATPGRATVMTMQHEIVKVSPSVADADVALPAGFREKK